MFGRKQRNDEPVKLNITSMMDMFTIILVFLLFSYSVEETDIHILKGVKLPNSKAQKAYEKSLTIQLSKNLLEVDRKAVARLRKGKFRDRHLDGLKVKPLYRLLRKMKKAQAKQKIKEKDKNIVLFMADKRIPFETVDQVLKTAGMAGYPNFRFTVYAK